jgi:conjugative relaxase-like TrwC/TraI family protein
VGDRGVRFTITPIGGAAGRPLDTVVRDVVRYLTRERPATAPPGPGGEGSAGAEAAGYYAAGEEDGRWLGRGSESMGLRGRVAAEDFSRVLSGRDPRTGERLVLASGSAGRKSAVGVGTFTRDGPDGDRWYDAHDAAKALNVEADDLQRLVAAGTQRAFGQLLATVTGQRPSTPLGPHLLARVGPDGLWVTGRELDRCQRARDAGASARDVEGAGAAGDLFSLPEAARLAGVTPRYLRRLALNFEKHRPDIEAAATEDPGPARAYLVGVRGTDGRWFVERRRLVEFLDRRTAPAVRLGYDLTLTTEKSLGVLALLSPSGPRDAVLAAIREGNDVALDWLEEHAARARVDGAVAETTGWTVAAFAHTTSRALDPFPHTHNVVAAATTTTDGQLRTLDARHLYRELPIASALATATMRHRLSARLGVRWRASPSGWEVAGIPGPVLREFSRRRNEIDNALAHLEQSLGRATTIPELEQIVLATRPPKEQADAADLLGDWWRRARAHGLEPEDLAAALGASIERTVDRDTLYAHLDSDLGVAATSSVFTRADVARAIVDAPLPTPAGPQPPLVTAAELLELTDGYLRRPEIVHLRPADGPTKGDLYATRATLERQHDIVDRFRRGFGAGLGLATTAAVERTLAGTTLGEDQQELVRRFCTSGHAVQCAIGRAGAGKTTALGAAAEAWRSEGWRVLGTAVKGEAARVLGDTARIPTETVAWYLAAAEHGAIHLDARTVLVVDEASTLSDADLRALMVLCAASGTALRLIGDPAQHSAVAPGGMFRVLCETHPVATVELAHSRRVQDPGDRKAAELLRNGDAAGALAALRDVGHLHFATDDANLYARLLASWWRGRGEGNPHPLVERSNHRRRQLNRLARRLLQVNGEIGPDVVQASGGRAFAVGDAVVARRGHRGLHPPDQPSRYVRNGAAGIVTGFRPGAVRHHDQIDVDFPGIGTVAVPRAFFDDHPGPDGRRDVGLDHAYALTSYAVQGATFGVSTSHIDEGSTRAEAYVDVTRGRERNDIFATRREDPLDGERLPKAPPPPLDVALGIRLARPGEVTAWELAQASPARTAPGPELSR